MSKLDFFIWSGSLSALKQVSHTDSLLPSKLSKWIGLDPWNMGLHALVWGSSSICWGLWSVCICRVLRGVGYSTPDPWFLWFRPHLLHPPLVWCKFNILIKPIHSILPKPKLKITSLVFIWVRTGGIVCLHICQPRCLASPALNRVLSLAHWSSPSLGWANTPSHVGLFEECRCLWFGWTSQLLELIWGIDLKTWSAVEEMVGARMVVCI